MKLGSAFVALNGMIYASITTLNFEPWFGESARRTANEANGVCILTLVQFLALLLLGNALDRTDTMRILSEEVVIASALILLTINYIVFVVKKNGAKYVASFMRRSISARIAMRLFVLFLFVLLSTLLFTLGR